ncbi:MAG: hypothetical protein ISS54_04345 [Dehalococcoidia bacterium]|nr:hypothetical protein [Dehalococcoidia bacterium]
MVLVKDNRWSNYFMSHGPDFDSFWDGYLGRSERNLMFVLGHGFDPRMCHAISLIFGKKGKGLRDCIALHYQDDSKLQPQHHADLLENNWANLNEVVKKVGGNILKRGIKMQSKGKLRYASISAANVFDSLDQLSDYTDIIIDVSAMPRGVYFPLIHKLLVLIDNAQEKVKPNPNLHIIVWEDQKLDSCIVDEGLEEKASYLHSFGAIELETTKDMPIVWIPVLGEGQSEQLEKIRAFINPNEVCPLLPFPSINPRRADALIAEYHHFLFFGELSVEPRSIIYADERNPFQAYREIRKTINHYDRVMDIIGGCKVAISPISSKLLSIGALLAAYESRKQGKLVGVTHVECHDYRIEGDVEDLISAARGVPHEIWLAGECYER